MRLAAGFATNRGLVRQTNEDSFLVRTGLYVVCDGMGGARAGEVASQMACERMVAVDPATAGTDELRATIVDANERISARSLAEPRLSGDGYHADLCARPRWRHALGPCGRFPRVPASRWGAPPADRRPFLGRGDGAPRRAHGGRSGGPPAPQRHHQSPRHRRRGPAGHPRSAAGNRRQADAVQRRPQRDGLRRLHSGPAPTLRTAPGCGRRADRCGAQGRR